MADAKVSTTFLRYLPLYTPFLLFYVLFSLLKGEIDREREKVSSVGNFCFLPKKLLFPAGETLVLCLEN